MTNKKRNEGLLKEFFELFTLEDIGVGAGALTGYGVGTVIDCYVNPLLISIVIQYLVCFFSPLVGMFLGGILGYRVVKSLLKQEDNFQSNNDFD